MKGAAIHRIVLRRRNAKRCDGYEEKAKCSDSPAKVMLDFAYDFT